MTSRPIARDAVGRATEGYRARYSLPDDSDRYTLTYGALGLLEAVDVDVDGSDDYSYYYNHRNLRVRKEGPMGSTHYVYDVYGRLLYEEDSVGSREYVYLGGGPVVLLVASGGPADVFLLGIDQLGTPMRAWDADTGSLAWAADYEAFGRAELYRDSPGLVVSLRFPGQYFDSETALHYNWYRYYDLLTGRYLQTDPLSPALHQSWTQIGNSVGALSDPWFHRVPSPYDYALQSPLKHVDLQGLAVALDPREAYRRCLEGYARQRQKLCMECLSEGEIIDQEDAVKTVCRQLLGLDDEPCEDEESRRLQRKLHRKAMEQSANYSRRKAEQNERERTWEEFFGESLEESSGETDPHVRDCSFVDSGSGIEMQCK